MRPTSMLPLPPGGASTRQSSGLTISQQQSSALTARIALKKAELDNLKQLCDLSGALAGQMQILEEKIATLNDGTEAVAVVLANWENVLRAISMASMKSAALKDPEKGKGEGDTGDSERQTGSLLLPETLVRISADQGKKN